MAFPSDPWANTLQAFDSHERGILLQWATGAPFALSPALRETLAQKLHLAPPESAFVAMDYTMDWLYAATQHYMSGGAEFSRERSDWPEKGQLTASAQDLDLVVGWKDDIPRLVLLEAKGFTGWQNKQLLAKVTRLNAIFDENVRRHIDVHFVLVSPKHSKGVSTKGWPTWLASGERYHHISIPDPGVRYAVQRRTPIPGPEGKTIYAHWRLRKRYWT